MPSAARLNFIRIMTPSIATWISLILMSGSAATILSVSSVLLDRRACAMQPRAAQRAKPCAFSPAPVRSAAPTCLPDVFDRRARMPTRVVERVRTNDSER